MEFKFSSQNLNKLEKILQRFFEILPAAISWGILLVMTILCLLRPILASAIIIAFGFYWFLRLLYMYIFFRLTRSRLELEAKTDWLKRAKGLNRIYAYWEELNEQEANAKGKQDLSFRIHRRELRILERSKRKAPHLEDLYHLVIIPAGGMNQETIARSVASLVGGNFPSLKIVVILAFEQGVSESAKFSAKRLIERYRERLFDLFAVTDPDQSHSEKSFKGALISYAASQAANYFKGKQIALEWVITSCLEPGSIVNPDYCSCLTYYYLVSVNRQTTCFQALAVYDNSTWQISAPKRVLDGAASFFQLITSMNADNLISFSNCSMSLATLVELNFWPWDLISADPAIFWKAFIYFNGAFTSKPLYVSYPINIKAGRNFSETLYQLYEQRRELASSGENFPIVMRAFLKAGRIPFLKRVIWAFKLLETQVLSGIWPFVLFVIGWLPALLAGRQFSDSGIYYSAPRITFVIFALMIVCLIMCFILTNYIFPKDKSKFNFFKQIANLLALIFLVPVGVFLAALASLDVQTNLMFGRRPKP